VNSSNLLSIAYSPTYVQDGTIIGVTPWNFLNKSTNRGQTWTRITGPTSDSFVSVALISGSTIFAGISNDGLYKSENGGVSWTEIGPDLWWTRSLAVSPAYLIDQTIFAQSMGSTWKSANGGQNWSQLSGPSNVRQVVVSPAYDLDGTVFATTDNGVYKSTNGGQNWNQISTLVASCNQINDGSGPDSFSISSHYALDQRLAISTADGVYVSSDGGQTGLKR
jgi:photosystem II stability/assembly factor-like uncharacterized protein